MSIAKLMISSFFSIEDFNVGIDENSMKSFCDMNGLKLSKSRYHRDPDKPTFIDLTLINRPSLFKHSNAFETSLSDFHL